MMPTATVMCEGQSDGMIVYFNAFWGACFHLIKSKIRLFQAHIHLRGAIVANACLLRTDLRTKAPNQSRPVESRFDQSQFSVSLNPTESDSTGSGVCCYDDRYS